MEIQLLSKIMLQNDISTPLNRGLSAMHFRSSDTKKWYLNILNYYQQYQRVPTLDIFAQRHADFKAQGHKATLEELTDEVIRLGTRQEALKHIEEITNQLAKNSTVDIGEKLLTAGKSVASMGSIQDKTNFKDMSSRINTYMTELQNGVSNSIKYLIPTLDAITGGMRVGELIIISGKPASGKSNLGRRIIGNAFKQDAKILAMTLEESRDHYVRRLDSMLHGISYRKMKNYDLTPSEIAKWQKMGAIQAQAKGDITILGGRMSSSLSDIIAGLEKYKPDLMLIDGVYMMRSDKNSIGSVEWQYQSAIFNETKKMALEYNIPIIGITQAGRQTDENNPKLEDMAFTYHIARVADIAMFMSNPSKSRNYRSLTVSKNRDGAKPSKAINLEIDFDTLRFKEVP